ncbi:unnamed protein product [Penicillium nalgiovense]|nr:unnamed protein product [Penicillium nalgiovense]
MPRTPARVKKWVNRFRRTNNGGNEEETTPPAQSAATSATAPAQSGATSATAPAQSAATSATTPTPSAITSATAPTPSAITSATAPVEAPATPTPESQKRRRGDNDGADDDDNDTPARPLYATPRRPRMWASGVSASMSASTNPDRIPILQSTPERGEIDKYRETGAKYENWMANNGQSDLEIEIAPSTLTLDELTNATPPNRALFTIPDTGYTSAPPEIRVALESTNLLERNDYRHTHLRLNKYRRVSTYDHYIVQGAIMAADISRKEGPYWADIALALYKYQAPINTLRYVFMLHVDNEETLPMVGRVLYKQLDLSGGPKDTSNPITHAWRRSTDHFQQILGTQLGRAVGRLVLAAWPAGTHQISEIHTWFVGGKLYMRFDIEEISSAGASGSGGASRSGGARSGGARSGGARSGGARSAGARSAGARK